ncbi:MAG: diadenylate cyclase CdaA [candidate division WOR-3 bacterium]|nr:diadenylate cyclase CdaA [candidate division WOR-3 bacterium]MCX7947605.1 diadenylate cyclase CdaA [candidate division WOR-3 bacterium]MDW8150490.1 diadenylate cyclase CdaA [candidate division WOR-3 bacterium]
MQILKSIEFSFFDIIDFLILLFIVYQFLKLFRGTRAPYMFLSVLIIVFLAVISEILKLSSMNLLINAFKTVGLVALIILFQPEIRRLLASIGQSRILRALTKGPKVPIDEIIEACYRISERGYGALIVIQNRMSLQDYLEEGIEIDAKLSSYLIESIFYPENPLHDGAIVIKEDRILSASVKLPRSSKLPDPLLGTRHEAAVGITEISDAISIVVSEERQTVRLAFKGELSPPIEKEELKGTIEAILNGRI